LEIRITIRRGTHQSLAPLARTNDDVARDLHEEPAEREDAESAAKEHRAHQRQPVLIRSSHPDRSNSGTTGMAEVRNIVAMTTQNTVSRSEPVPLTSMLHPTLQTVKTARLPGLTRLAGTHEGNLYAELNNA
jgi:hypothetical protein